MRFGVVLSPKSDVRLKISSIYKAAGAFAAPV